MDDIEEFHAKLEQIGADRTKGTVVTTGKFQSGAVAYAKSKGIGLVRMVPQGRWEYVTECWASEPEQDAIAAGLLDGHKATLGAGTYTLDERGRFGYDLGEYINDQLEA